MVTEVGKSSLSSLSLKAMRIDAHQHFWIYDPDQCDWTLAATFDRAIGLVEDYLIDQASKCANAKRFWRLSC